MAATTALSGVLFVLVAYSPSLPQLLLWRTSAGLLCANTVLVTSFIADSTSVQNRPPVLAVFGLAWALAGVCAGSVVWLSGSDVAVCAGSALICMLAASAYALMRLGGGSVQVSSGCVCCV